MADYVGQFATAIGLPQRERDRLVSAARFHDLGKITVDVATLSKEGRLSDAELRSIRRHARLSARLLAPFHFAQEMALCVELHHERYDGRGYYSVAPREIPIEAYVLIVADSFDAMTSARPYRPALPFHEAAEELRDKAGTQFHPLVSRAFSAMIVGEDIETALEAHELTALRGAFSRVRMVSLPERDLFLHPRAVTVHLAVLSLILLGLPWIPAWSAAIAGAGTLVAAALWGEQVARSRWWARRALAVIDGGEPPAAALLAAGNPGWAAWLDVDRETGVYSGRETGGRAPPARELEEACNWALRREHHVQAELSTGTHLVLAPANGEHPRLAYGLERPPTPLERDFLRLVEERLRRDSSPPRPAPLELVHGTNRRAPPLEAHAVVLVELDAFENVRRAAGQLSAERVADEAEYRLRTLLRETDAITRLDDDRFGLAVAVPGHAGLEAFSRRIHTIVRAVPLPSRAAPLEPRVTAALREEIASHPELAALERELAIAVPPTSLAVAK